MLYSVESKKVTLEPMPAGVANFMSFERFVKLLKSSGETMNGEVLTHIEIGRAGFNFRYERKK